MNNQPIVVVDYTTYSIMQFIDMYPRFSMAVVILFGVFIVSCIILETIKNKR